MSDVIVINRASKTISVNGAPLLERVSAVTIDVAQGVIEATREDEDEPLTHHVIIFSEPELTINIGTPM